MEQKAINTVINTATLRWHRNKQPGTFRTKVATRKDENIEHVNVHIYHHETFPLGGQSFTVDVRNLPGQQEQYGELVHRDRIHLTPDQVRR